jgi:hypothetical protein
MANKNKQKPKEDDGCIPKHIINQLGEHTVGGFMLFYFNNKTGEPEQIMSFDTPSNSLALQKYITDWLDAVQQINHDNIVCSIEQGVYDAMNPPDDEDDGEAKA